MTRHPITPFGRPSIHPGEQMPLPIRRLSFGADNDEGNCADATFGTPARITGYLLVPPPRQHGDDIFGIYVVFDPHAPIHVTTADSSRPPDGPWAFIPPRLYRAVANIPAGTRIAIRGIVSIHNFSGNVRPIVVAHEVQVIDEPHRPRDRVRRAY